MADGNRHFQHDQGGRSGRGSSWTRGQQHHQRNFEERQPLRNAAPHEEQNIVRGDGYRGGWRGQRSRGRAFHRGGRGGGNHYSNRNNFHYKQRRPMQEKDFKKENFYCCSCERGFKQEDQYIEHNKEHIVCGLDGCQFEAHSLVVTKHIRMQHEGNFYQRMKNLNTPEDIQRWREERKKNFPTVKKIEEKPQEENTKTREVLEVRNGGFNPSTFCYRIRRNDPRDYAYITAQRRLYRAERNQGDDWTKRPFAPDMRFRNDRVPFFSLNKSKMVTLENFYLSVKCGKDGKVKKETKVKWKAFRAKTLERLPDSESENDDEIPISDEEDYFDDKTDEKSLAVAQAPVVDSNDVATAAEKSSMGLGLSLIDYSSASDSEEETNKNQGDSSDSRLPNLSTPENSLQTSTVGSTELKIVPSDKSTNNLIEDSISANSKSLDESDSESEDSTAFTIFEFDRDTTFKDKRIVSTVNGRRFKRRRSRPQLLEALLRDEILEERSAILQVCRFVMQNNFFDVTK